MIAGLEEKVLNIAEKDICNCMSTVGQKWVTQDLAYRFSANPLVTGIADRSDEFRPPQVTSFRREPGERTPREA